MPAQEKNALYPSEHSDFPALVPNLQEAHVIQSPDFLLQQGSSFPWYSHELILVPEARSGSCTLSCTLARRPPKHHTAPSRGCTYAWIYWHRLVEKGGQPAVPCCGRLFLSRAHFRFFDVNAVAMVAPVPCEFACVFVTVGSLLGTGVTHIRPLWCGGSHQVPAPHYLTSVLVQRSFEGMFFLRYQGTEACG